MGNIKIVSPKTNGEKERIKRLQKRGFKSVFTDFAAALKGHYMWELQTINACIRNKEDFQLAIEESTNQDCVSFINGHVGIRPVVAYDKIKGSCHGVEYLGDGITREQYGEYPKSKVTEEELVNIYIKANKGLFKPTGKVYTIHQRDPYCLPIIQPTCTYPIYRHRSDRKVIQLREFVDNTGKKFVKYNNSWFKVEPVSMLVDRDNNIAVTEEVIYSGLPYETFNIRSILKTSIDRYEELEDLLQADSLDRIKERQNQSLKGFINNILLKDLIPSEVNFQELFPNQENELKDIKPIKINPIYPIEPIEIDPIYPIKPIEIDPVYPVNPEPDLPWNPWYPQKPTRPYYPWYRDPLKPYMKLTGNTPAPEIELSIKKK
jgi:hypothetical protein